MSNIGLHYIPARWPGSLKNRVEECWSRRRYRLRMVAEGRWDYLRFDTRCMVYGAIRAVYYGNPEGVGR